MLVYNDPIVTIDKSDNMYPCMLHKINDNTFEIPKTSTVFGFVLEGYTKISETKIIEQHEYFSINSLYQHKSIICAGSTVIFIKYGYNGQNNFGGPVEKQGRLSYINNCSDSMLIYPPRKGDPSMNFLHFPENIIQDFHTHPTLRFGVVFKGQGTAEFKNGISINLQTGTVFCINDQEIHRFITNKSNMGIISFHPDGDWGPTDHDHTLINRTYIK